MELNDQVYIKLRKHLDSQAVGFPATKTGAEIRVLKHIFTPEEAEIACFLNYKMEPLEVIHSRVRHLVAVPEDLKEILDRIQKKGGIEFKMKGGKKHYCNSPFVIGIYEFQVNRLTPEFKKDLDDFISDRNFGIELLSTKLPQMRTIPVAKSIRPQHSVSTFDEVTKLIQQSEGSFMIMECICRKKKSMEGENCKATDRKETCLGMGSLAQMFIPTGAGREIGRDEAMSIIEQNQKEGLVLQPSNTQKADFICSCCGCCCGMLDMHKKLPKPLDYWASNFQASVNASTCDGCGTCVEWCQVGAISIAENKQQAVVDLNRCLGCGLCVTNCPTESISLVKKADEVKPPETREELYEIIMANKKGRLGKLKIAGKMVIDAVRTGQTHLLKS